MFDIAVIGRAMWDEWVLPATEPRADEDPDGRDCFGGSAANIAVHLAHLGHSVTLAASFGTDWRSRRYVDYLHEAGVDLSFSVWSTDPLARCRMRPGKGCERVGEQQGFPSFDREHLVAVTAASRAVFFSELAPSAGSKLPALAYWSPQRSLAIDATPDRPSVRSVASLGWRAIFLNERESRQVTSALKATISKLSTETPRTKWIVTNEGEPTTVSREGSTSVHPVPPAECEVSVGGGDAFAAGVCAGDLRGWPAVAGLQLGHALAGRVISQVGCQLPAQAVRRILSHAVPPGA